MRRIFGFALLAILAAMSCQGQEGAGEKAPGRKKERTHVVIDEKAIAAATDAFTIIEPVWYSAVAVPGGEDLANLARFSQGQRLLVAVTLYEGEVINGGHDQFYYNSSGSVWENAIKGFREMDAPEAAAILEESAKRMGGRPPFNRDARIRMLESRKPDFTDLDKRFYELDEYLEAKKLEYIKKHPKEFLFDGEIEK